MARPTDQAPRARTRRSLHRLREELVDARFPAEIDGRHGDALLQEIHYARRPPVHERYVPTYGALVFPGRVSEAIVGPQQATMVDSTDLTAEQARRFADGRGCFLVRDETGVRALACFEHSVEYEANLVALQRNSGAAVVQRTRQDIVKVFAAGTVVTWDRVRWMHKPYADRFQRVVLDLVPDCPESVLAGLLEFCVHWLSPGFHGATLVWNLDGPAADLAGVERSSTRRIPPLSVRRREHFPAILSALAQTDGAALVDPDGRISTLSTTLLVSAEAARIVPAVKGTRHTSARRFSFDQPSTLVAVVSDDGPVSIFQAGARIALVETSTGQDPATPGGDTAGEETRRCSRCTRAIRIDLPPGWDRQVVLTCPVCGESLGIAPAGSVTKGVDAPAG